MARRKNRREPVYGARRSRTSAVRVVSEWTREEMGISSINELDDKEREVFNGMVDMIASGRYDASWKGPHALWLAMVGRRPVAVRVDVDSKDSTARMQGRIRDWRAIV